jgi:D-3-phosphoglycerate dehydrogenase
MGKPPVVVVSEPIHEAGVRLLAEHCQVVTASDASPAALLPLLPEASGLLVRLAEVSAELLAAAPQLRVIARHGVGVDNIDVAAATRRGIPVVYTPEANAVSVAEHVLALMTALAKRIVEYDAATRRGAFAVRDSLRAVDLEGKVLGVVGLGRVGTAVSRKAKAAFNMRVLGYDPFLDSTEIRSRGAEPVSDLPSLLREADVVTLHVPLTPQTRRLIGKGELAAMKPTAMLVNTSRGAVVDEAALAQALHQGRLAGAALDVFEREPPDPGNPLFSAPNLVVTPHSAALTAECAARMALQAAQGIMDVLAGRRPAAVVNPEVFST